jgi:hypothetical protein
MLRAKMASSAVRELDLECFSDFRHPPLPACLGDFKHLQRLSILRSQDLVDDVVSDRMALKGVSPSLEALTLNFSQSEHILLEDVPEPFSWIFEEESVGDQNESRLWNLAERFPKLRSLDLIGGTPGLLDCDMAHLPRTLTHLGLSKYNSITPQGLSLLPEGLKSLRTTNTLLWPSASQLPPSLETIHDPLRYFYPEEMVTPLPSTLESVFVGSKTFFNNFPPGLQSLIYSAPLPSPDGIQWSFMPLLTKLTIRVGQNPITTEFVSLLPSTLTSLELHSQEMNLSDMGQRTFPPKLIRLVMGTGQFDASTLSSLPSCIQTFDINALDQFEQITNWTSLLPRSLTAFSVTLETIHGELTHWPPYLSQCFIYTRYPTSRRILRYPLNLEFPHSRQTETDLIEASTPSVPSAGPSIGLDRPQCSYATLLTLRLDSITGIQDEMIAKLPASLTNLALPHCISVSPACFAVIPPYLESLDLSSMFGQIEDASQVAMLPGTLRNLSICKAEFYYSHSRAEDYDDPIAEEYQEMAIQIVRALPRQLKSFNHQLNFHHDFVEPDFMERLLSALPDSLETLEIPNWEIHSNQFSRLPRSLRTASISLIVPITRSLSAIAAEVAAGAPKYLDLNLNLSSSNPSLSSEIFKALRSKATHTRHRFMTPLV